MLSRASARYEKTVIIPVVLSLVSVVLMLDGLGFSHLTAVQNIAHFTKFCDIANR